MVKIFIKTLSSEKKSVLPVFAKQICGKDKYFSQPRLSSNFWGRISGVTIDLIELYSGIKKFYRERLRKSL